MSMGYGGPTRQGYPDPTDYDDDKEDGPKRPQFGPSTAKCFIVCFLMMIGCFVVIYLFFHFILAKEKGQKVEIAPVTREEKITILLDEFKKFPGDKGTQGELIKIGKSTVSCLRAFLEDKDNYKITREGHLKSEGRGYRERSLSMFDTGWASPPGYMWEVRLGTVEVLDRIGGKEVIEPLIYAIDDPHILVAEAAAEVLAKRKERRAVEPLIKAMKNHLFPGAVEALGEIGDERAINPLLDELKNKERIEKYDLYEYKINKALVRIRGVPPR